jgi:hypothetical protein
MRNMFISLIYEISSEHFDQKYGASLQKKERKYSQADLRSPPQAHQAKCEEGPSSNLAILLAPFSFGPRNEHGGLQMLAMHNVTLTGLNIFRVQFVRHSSPRS